jgi:hypothetical protein
LGAERRDDASRIVKRRADRSRPAAVGTALPCSAATVAATVDAPIDTPVCLAAATVELPVGNVAAPVEAPLDAIAAIGGSRCRPVTGRILRQDRPAEQAQAQSRGRNETSLSHVPSPRKP